MVSFLAYCVVYSSLYFTFLKCHLSVWWLIFHPTFQLVFILLIMSALHFVSFVFNKKCRGFVQQLFSYVLLKINYMI